MFARTAVPGVWCGRGFKGFLVFSAIFLICFSLLSLRINKLRKKQAREIISLIGEIVVLLHKCLWFIGEGAYRLLVPVNEKSVKGEIVLITGAGHGIGKDLALEYASQGATVVCWDINKTSNLETVEEITKLGYPKSYAYVCDVGKREEVMKIAKEVQKEVGDVSILINNAGIMPIQSFLDYTLDEIGRTMNINTLAHYWTLQAFLPAMKKKNYGHIVAIASALSLMTLRNMVPYCASKYAVRGMMEALYQDLHADSNCQIKITTIYPYAVDTGLCKISKLRFQNLMSFLKPRDVAKYIMSAQRRNVIETTIPGWILTILCYMRFFPIKMIDKLYGFGDSYAVPEEKRFKHYMPKN